MQCPSCGVSLQEEAKYCPNCGNIIPYNVSNETERRREPLVAAETAHIPPYRQVAADGSLPNRGMQPTPSSTPEPGQTSTPPLVTADSLPVASQPSQSSSTTTESSSPSLSRRKASILLYGLSFIVVGFLVGYTLYALNELSPLVVSVVGGIAILTTLISGVFGAALSGSMLKGLRDIWRNANKPPAILAGILTGALVVGIVAVPPRLISYYASDPYTHTGKFEFQDPLDSNMHQHTWSQQLGCDFLKGGGYQAESDQSGWFHACIAEDTNLSNLVYEVQMNITSGDCGGLIFEAVDGTPTHAYVFFVCQNGHFYLNRYDDGRNFGNWGNPNTRYSNLNEPLNPLPNGFIPIAVVARPNQIVLYVNHNPVKTLTENMYQGGSIGVIAFDHTHTTTAGYKDVKVWKF